MRFPRHARILKGPLDPAPVAGTLFLLLMFILLTSLLYTPGALVQLARAANAPAATIEVARNGQVYFEGATYTNLEALRADVKQAPAGAVSLLVRPGANPKVVEEVRDWFRVTPPLTGSGGAGTDNPTAVVAVNFRGQCFYENRMVEEKELVAALQKRLQEAAQQSKRLTLVLWVDKTAEVQVETHLCDLALSIGIKDVMLAEQPAAFGPGGGKL